MGADSRPTPHRWRIGDNLTAQRLDTMSRAILVNAGKAAPPNQQVSAPAPPVEPDQTSTPALSGASYIGNLTEEVEIPIYSLDDDGNPDTSDQIGVATVEVDAFVTFRFDAAVFGGSGLIDIVFEMPTRGT